MISTNGSVIDRLIPLGISDPGVEDNIAGEDYDGGETQEEYTGEQPTEDYAGDVATWIDLSESTKIIFL